MQLLILTPQFPYPPHQGATLRNFNLLANLAQRHSVHLFSLLAPGDSPETGPVRGLVQSLLTASQPQRTTAQRLRHLFLSPLPDMALRLWNPAAFDLLAAHIAAHPPDAIQIEGIEMAPYLLALRKTGQRLPIVLYDAHNAETLLQQRAFWADLRRPSRWPAAAYSAVQIAKLRRYERGLLEIADAVAAVSEADAATLRQMAPKCVPAVISNGVDLDFYDPAHPYPDPFLHAGPNLVFTGKMDFRPNVDAALWFAERVLPPLHATNLDPHFWIVGRNPHPRLETLRGRPDITIVGAVDDIRPYVAHADVYVAPLLTGSGSRLKILEAMAMARPIVSTRMGADGFPLTDGEQLALVDNAADFIIRCRQLMLDPSAAAAMGQRARAYVVESYDWRRIAPRLEQHYLEIGRGRLASWSGQEV